jgi:Kef-type K+ transport system membrane component KefB
MDFQMRNETLKGLFYFLIPTFFITVGVIVLCVYWLRPLALSPLLKTAITLALILLTISSCTFVVRKLDDVLKKDR